MSLDWSIEKVVDSQELIDDEEECVVTKVAVFATMSVGMASITEANVDEFFIRLRMADEVFGPTLIENGEHRSLRHDEVVRRIGLRTNATSKTKTQFHKFIADQLRWTAEHDLRSEQRKADAA